MYDEASIYTRERSELISRRLPTFAFGWLGTLVIWLVVFAVEGRITVGAIVFVALAAAVLRTALTTTRADPGAERVLPVTVATCVALGLGCVGLVHSVGAYGEILAFLLLTLYLMSALLFAWGWAAELTLLFTTLGPWVMAFDAFPLFVPMLELGAAVTIGAGLALGVAEASARYVQQVLRRRRAQYEATLALQASHDAYRDLAEKAPDLIWMADRGGRLTYVNEALAHFLGLPAPALIGHEATEFATSHPDNPDFSALFARLLTGGDLPATLLECMTPRGPRWLEATATPIVDEHGAVIGIRGIDRDVTERRAAAEALRASEARYRGLVESQNELVVRMDPTGHFTFVNDAYATTFGRSPAALLGQSFLCLVHPDDHSRIAEAMAQMAAPPHRTCVEVRNLTANGVRWIAWEGGIVLDAGGRLVEAQAVGRDVTERRAFETNLRESEERFRSAFDDAGIGMALTTIEGCTIRVNPALCAMLGYTEAELLETRPEHIVHPDDRQAFEVDRERLGDGQAPFYRAERRYRHRDGHLLWVHVTASMVRDVNGAPLYFLGQIQDITERRVAEDALRDSIAELRRSEEKLRLLAQRQVLIREEERKRVGFDLHDDVCQELVGVGILVESLRRKLAPMSAEHAGEFERVVRYLGEVIEHLRLLARELRPLLLRDLGLDGSLRSLADGMASPTLRIVTEFPAPIPRLDEETEVIVYRIAQEALTNAVRHARAHTIAVTVSTDDGKLVLEVADDGRGFDPMARPAVALGLASMEERALALGGRLDIRSAPEEGTTVTLVCPLGGRGLGRIRELAGPSPTRSSSRPSATTTPRSAARD